MRKRIELAEPDKPAEAPGATAGDRAPDFHWNGRPVYRCRQCAYERVENLAAVLEHEQEHQASVRPSRIVGTDGEPLQVLDGIGDYENG